MKTKIYLLVVFSVIVSASIAQNNHYYYYKGEKVYLTLDKNSLDISVFEDFKKTTLNDIGLKEYILKEDKSLNITSNLKYGKIEFQVTPTDIQYSQKVNAIKKTKGIRTVSPNFIGQGGTKIGMSDYFYVKLRNKNDYPVLQQQACRKSVLLI